MPTRTKSAGKPAHSIWCSTGIPAFALALLLLAACGRESAAPSSANPPVIIISIDTLRADRLPAYGYQGVTTPAIDALRKDGILFQNAYAHVPMTLPSHASLFTGLLPPSNGVRNNLGYTLDAEKHPTLASILRKYGYATGGAVSAYVIRGSTGINGGFDWYDDSVPAQANASVGELWRAGSNTAAAAQTWLEPRINDPFFLFFHLFEPHTPYDPPEPYRSAYADRYDGEIAASDAVVGNFIAWLKAKGVYDRALIILLSDHGEGLGDHGESEHGVFLYREAIHVPLIVKLPDSERRGESVTSIARLVDVMPTVLSVVKAEVPPNLDGRSLFEEGQDDRQVYSETVLPRLHLGWSDLRSLLDARYHYIEAPRPELYDHKADPAEKTNVLTDNRRVYAAMKAELAKHGTTLEGPADINPEDAAKLAALGYLGSVRQDEGPLPDPKDRIGDLETMRKASQLEQGGRFDEAIAAYRSILDQNPRFTDAWIRLAAVYERVGRVEEAEKTYRRAIETAPSLAAGNALTLGNLQLRLGKLDEAEKHAQLAMSNAPSKAGAHLLLARVLIAKGQFQAAEREAFEAAKDPTRHHEASLVAVQAMVGAGRGADALAAIERLRVEAGGAGVMELESTRGDLLARMERYAEAETAFRTEIAKFPHNLDAYAKLAILYATQGRIQDADNALRQMFEAKPEPSTAMLASRTWEALGASELAARWKVEAERGR